MAETDLSLDLDDLSGGFAATSEVTAAFRAELTRVQAALDDTDKRSRSLSRSMGANLRSAFEGLVFDGDRLSDTLGSLGRSIASSAFSAAVKPVQSAVEGGVAALISGLMPFAAGGVISSGRVRAFASGGVVDGPTVFGLDGGLGLMGEAGPEAIMPLARGADGRLGVRGGGGGAVHVTMHVSTPDVRGFERSRPQIAAGLSRALRRGQRNL